MRTNLRAEIIAVCACLALGPTRGWAQAAGTIPSFQLERIQVDQDGTTSLLVGSGKLLEPGTFRLSAGLQYERSPLIAYDVSGERLGAVIGNRLTAYLVGAWAPSRLFELGVMAPYIGFQNGADLTGIQVAPPASHGLGTAVLTGRFAIPASLPLDLAAEIGVGLPTGSTSALAQDVGFFPISANGPGTTFRPRLMAGKSFPWVSLAAEVGALVRPSVVLGANTLGSQLEISGAVATRGEGLRCELSGHAVWLIKDGLPAYDVLAGARYPVKPDLEVYALGGPGFGAAPGTPLYRILVGVAWHPLSRSAPTPATSETQRETPEQTVPTKQPEQPLPAPSTNAAAASDAGTPQTMTTPSTPSPTSSSAPSPSPAPPASEPPTYTIRKGDQLSRVARDHHVSLKALLAANPGIKPEKIAVGQTILLPAPPAPVLAPPDAGTPVTPTAPSTPPPESSGPPNPALSPQTQSEQATYTIRRGDELDKIARANHVSLKALLAANPGIKPEKIAVGQTIRLPTPPAPAASTPDAGMPGPSGQTAPLPAQPSGSEATTYVVRRGDVFDQIAAQYGLTAKTLLAVNPQIKDPGALEVGQVLYLPPGSVPKPSPGKRSSRPGTDAGVRP